MRIAHANIQVSDVRASLAFYRALGLELLGCLRVDPVVLYYVGTPAEPNLAFELADNPDLATRAPGSGHVALAVGDLDALLERLAREGVEPESAPFRPAERPDVRICFVRDPDGTRVELIAGDFPTPNDPLPDGVAV